MNRFIKITLSLLMVFSLFRPAPIFADSQPPYEVKDPATAENFRQIYYGLDSLKLNTSGPNVCINSPDLCVDTLNHRVSIGTTTSAGYTLKVRGGNASEFAVDNDGSRFTEFDVLHDGAGRVQQWWDETTGSFHIDTIVGTNPIGFNKGGTFAGVTTSQGAVSNVAGDGDAFDGSGTSAGTVSLRLAPSGASTNAARVRAKVNGTDTDISLVTSGLDRLTVDKTGFTTLDVAVAKAFRIDTQDYNADAPAALELIAYGGTGIRFLPSAGTGKFNWNIAAQYNVNNSLEFTPSTASGGTTFSAPALIIDPTGIVTMPKQPCFLVYNSTRQTDITGDATDATLAWDTEIYDKHGDFASNTFTAPITGKYLLIANVLSTNNAAAHNITQLNIVTSNRTYTAEDQKLDVGERFYHISVVADMDAGNTATVHYRVWGGTKVVDVYESVQYSNFSGSLLN